MSQDKDLAPYLRLQVSAALLMGANDNYAEKIQALHMILLLNQKEAVQHYLEKNWRVVMHTSNVADIPFLAEIAQQEVVSAWVRDSMYRQMRKLLS